MALDFPSNPTDGQIFGSYNWSASKGVWQAREESAAVAITSSVKPLTANNGDFWYNTSTGITYIYYDDGTSGQWVEVVTSGLPSAEQIMPTGSIIQTARSTAPNLWLLCQGQAISRSNYQSLYNAIGTSYGAGDGSTTFNVPNLQGRVPVGRDATQTEFDVLGETGGAKTHTLTTAQMPSHTHIQNSHTHTGTTNGDGGHQHNIRAEYGTNVNLNNAPPGYYNQLSTNPGYGFISNYTQADGNHTHGFTTAATTATNQNTGGDGAHNNLQPYIVLNYMIKV